MQLYASELAKVTWSVIVWDEGHHLKTDTTKGYRAAFRSNFVCFIEFISISLSKAQCRLILTGTPIQNKLEELWCLLNLVTHGRFNVCKLSFFHLTNCLYCVCRIKHHLNLILLLQLNVVNKDLLQMKFKD